MKTKVRSSERTFIGVNSKGESVATGLVIRRLESVQTNDSAAHGRAGRRVVCCVLGLELQAYGHLNLTDVIREVAVVRADDRVERNGGVRSQRVGEVGLVLGYVVSDCAD